jgi:hypothetical protein
MAAISKKRTLDSFFTSMSKKARPAEETNQAVDTNSRSTSTEEALHFSTHSTYPFPIPCLPKSIQLSLSSLPSTVGKPIDDQPDLDLLYFQPYIPKYLEKDLFEFLRSQLPFYRVEYKIKHRDPDPDS